MGTEGDQIRGERGNGFRWMRAQPASSAAAAAAASALFVVRMRDSFVVAPQTKGNKSTSSATLVGESGCSVCGA